MKKKNASVAVAVAAVLLLALSGCKEEAPPETQQLVYPPVRHIAAVVDGTGSTNVAFSESVKAAIMEELRIREMPPEETLKDGTDGVPGTRMLLYRVADNPQAFDGIAHWVKIEIDPVPALPPRPTVDADGDEYALEKYAAWKDLKLSYIEAYKKAAQMSQKAIRDLTAFSLDSGGKYSGIYNSIDALMANAGADAEQEELSLLIFSDLLNNVEPAVTVRAPVASAADWRASIVVAIPDGDVEAAAARFEEVRGILSEYGLSDIAMERADDVHGIVKRLFAEACR